MLAMVVELDDCDEERIAYASAPLLSRAGRTAEEVRHLYVAGAVIAPDASAAQRCGAWAGGATLISGAKERQHCVLAIRPLGLGSDALERCGSLALWVVVRIGACACSRASALRRGSGAAAAGGEERTGKRAERAGSEQDEPAPPSLDAVLAHWHPLLDELSANVALLSISRPTRDSRAAAAPSAAHRAALDRISEAPLDRHLQRVLFGTAGEGAAGSRNERAALEARVMTELARAGRCGGCAALEIELPRGERAVCVPLPLWDARGHHAFALLVVIQPEGHAQTLGPFVLREGARAKPVFLGRGSVAEVRRATIQLGTRNGGKGEALSAAVKTIHLHSTGTELLQSVWAEVRVLRRLRECEAARRGHADNAKSSSCSSLVNRLLGCFIGPQWCHLVVSCAPGIELQALCERADLCGEAIASSACRCLLAQLCHALLWLHDCGVYHRDVKPSNVVVDLQARTLVLVDLNCAGIRSGLHRGGGGGGGSGDGGALPSSERAWSPMHTPLYVAPDIIAACAAEAADGEGRGEDGDGEGYDPFAADVWGIGCCLLQMLLAGNAPAQGLVRARQGEAEEDGGPRLILEGMARLLTTVEDGATGSTAADGASEPTHMLALCLAVDPRERPPVAQLCSHPFVAGAPAAGTSASSGSTDGRYLPCNANWQYGDIIWRAFGPSQGERCERSDETTYIRRHLDG
jgi:serine/threonine protein kinase